MVAGKTWERDTEDLVLGHSSGAVGVDMLSTEAMLGSGPDLHSPMGKDLN